MSKTLQFVVLAMLTHSTLQAQAPASQSNLQRDIAQWRFRHFDSRQALLDQKLAERRAAQQKEREFAERMRRFADIWKGLVDEYKEQGTFNVKKARQLSKAFHEIETTEGWPKRRVE